MIGLGALKNFVGYNFFAPRNREKQGKLAVVGTGEGPYKKRLAPKEAVNSSQVFI